MGSRLCSSGAEEEQFDPFSYDPLETRVEHEQLWVPGNPEVAAVLAEALERLVARRSLFKDRQVRSGPLSLEPLGGEAGEGCKECEFLRPYKFMRKLRPGQPYPLFDPKPAASRVVVADRVLQYLGVFLCFLADRPALLRGLILSEPNSFGVHAVRVLRGGAASTVFIDDCFLCCGGTPVFSQPVGGEYMWPLVLEKAWLKEQGEFLGRIRNRTPEQVFATFLEWPVLECALAGEQGDEARVLRFLAPGRLRAEWGYFFTSRQEPRHSIGLSLCRHIYILGSLEHEGAPLLLARNPWLSEKDFNYRGKVSPSHPEYAALEARARAMALPAGERGNFFMTLPEFLEQVRSFAVVLYSPRAALSSCPLRLASGNEFLASFSLRSRTECCLFLRLFADEPAPILFQVLALGRGQLFAGEHELNASAGSLVLFEEGFRELPPGRFLVRLKLKDPRRQELRCALGAIAAQSLEFEYRNVSFLEEGFRKELREVARRRAAGAKFRGEELRHTVLWLGSLVVVYLRNATGGPVSLEVSFPNLRNLESIDPVGVGPAFTTIKDVGEEALIVFEWIDLDAETSIGEYSIDYF